MLLSQRDVVAYGWSILKPLETTLGNMISTLRDLDDDSDPERSQSHCHYIISQVLTLLGSATNSPLWPAFYPTSQFESDLLDQLQAIRIDIEEIPRNTTPTRPPTPPAPVLDITPVVAALDKRFNDFKEETTSSIRSFADAVKVTAPKPPPNPSPPPKPKNSLPPVKKEQLPQAVV